MVRHVKLPEKLYLSPPQSPNTPSSYSYLKPSTFVASVGLLNETSSSALAVSDRIPGFKTSAGRYVHTFVPFVARDLSTSLVFSSYSDLVIGRLHKEPLTESVHAAFLNSLRANLSLGDESAPPSLVNTPDSLHPTAMASSTGSLPPPSPSPLTQPLAVPDAPPDLLNDVPPLTTAVATTTDDKIEALRLVADSVAQQRQYASKAMIFHPLTIAAVIGLLAVVGQWLYDGTRGSYGMIATTYAGIVMAVLAGVRYATGGYIELAENVGTWKWFGEGSTTGKEDDLILSKFGEEPIGALVLRGVKVDDGSNVGSSRKKKQTNAGMKGLIRGWTVKNRYRHKGVGEGLLEEAVKICTDRGWSGPTFADNHANSGRILPRIFNGGFDRREKMGREMLERVVEQSGGSPTGGGKGGRTKK